VIDRVELHLFRRINEAEGGAARGVVRDQPPQTKKSQFTQRFLVGPLERLGDRDFVFSLCYYGEIAVFRELMIRQKRYSRHCVFDRWHSV